MNNLFRKIKINKTLLAGLVGFVVIVGAILFYSTSKEKSIPSSSPESITNTTSSSGDDNYVSTWDAKTGSIKQYESYEAMEQELEAEQKKDLDEYNKAIKGTIVERVQNIAIPSYLDGEQLVQLHQGEILIKEPASEEFPEGNSLWAANLQKNKNSFVVGDFNKDGADDVAHIIGYTGFGSGYFYELIIFINTQGKLKYLTQKELGDRVVIKSVKYNSGFFSIDMVTQGEGDNFKGYCCPNVDTTVKLKLKNDQLVEL